MSKRVKVTIVVVAVLGAVLVLAGLNLNGNATFYYTVDELLGKRVELADKFVQVKGYVVPGTLHYNSTSLDMNFEIEEKGKRVKVFYHGLKPDTLNDQIQPATGRGIEVVAAGRLAADGSDVFQAKNLMVKCPSRYIQKGSSQPANNAGSAGRS